MYMSRGCMSQAAKQAAKQWEKCLFMIFDATPIKIAWWCSTAFDELDQMLNSFSVVIITFSLLHTISVLVGVEWSNKLARKSSLSLGQPACNKEQFTFKKLFKKPFIVRWTKQKSLEKWNLYLQFFHIQFSYVGTRQVKNGQLWTTFLQRKTIVVWVYGYSVLKPNCL